MRVATKTMYDSGVYLINSNLSDLNSVSEKVSTEKKINQSSDDPVGYARVQSVDTALGNMEQVQRNITIGSSWTSNTESVLTTINDCILDARDTALELSGSYMDESEREAVGEQINDIIIHLGELASTKIDGSYIFSGTKTDIRPIVFDDNEWPTDLTYQGNDVSYKIDSGYDLYSEVSLAGCDVFFSTEIDVDDTNNIINFQENSDTAQLTGVIAEGDYTAEELAEAIEDAMEAASQAAAYRVTGINNSTGIATLATVSDYSKLDMASTGSFQADWDGQGWALTGNGGYTSATVASDSTEDELHIDLDNDGAGDIVLYMETSMTTGSISFDVTAQAAVDYTVSYDDTTASFTIEENGTSLTELNLLWESGTESGQSIAPDIGFSSDLTGASSYTGDTDVTWGIFQTLIDLRDALSDDDTDGITRAITRLNGHYDETSTNIARAGIRTLFMETREDMIESIVLNLETEKSGIEDVDMVSALSDLSAKQTAYEAALAAYSQIISVSILDYI